MRIRSLIPVFTLLVITVAGVAEAQEPMVDIIEIPGSPNQCFVPGSLIAGGFSDIFVWTMPGSNPVGPPIEGYADLNRNGFLEPNRGLDGALTLKPWQELVAQSTGLTVQDFLEMHLAYQQGEGVNFRLVQVMPCERFVDMMAGDAPPFWVGRPTVADFADMQPRDAWVYETTLPDGNILQLYFIEDCRNPAYKIAPRPETLLEVTEAVPPPEPEPIPEPEPQVEDVCPNIEGIQSAVPQGMVITGGQCLIPQPEIPPPPPPVEIAETIPCPAINIDMFSRGWERAPLGIVSGRNVVEWLASIGVGAGIAAATSDGGERLRAAGISAAASTAANMAAQTFNPEENRVRITVDGEEVVSELEPGDSTDFDGGRAQWSDGAVRVYVNNSGGSESLCAAAFEGRQVNFTPVAIGREVKEKTTTVFVPEPPKDDFTPPPNVQRPAVKREFTPPPNTVRPR